MRKMTRTLFSSLTGSVENGCEQLRHSFRRSYLGAALIVANVDHLLSTAWTIMLV
jgi:hypothetical protein